MPTTSKGLRYPAASAAPHVPQDMQNLASDVDARLFTNAGTSGVASGSAPAAGTALKVKTFYGSVVLNSNGDGTITFPGGAFSSALLGVWVNHITIGGTPSNDLEFVPWQSTSNLTSVNVRCYGPTGAVFGNTGVSICMLAIGV